MSVAVSVLMCAYNAEIYLKDAIDSILEQTFQDFEFIIINDASNDATESIITSYKDQRIKYYTNNQNIGLTRSLNIGLEKCKGRYIARMDADDVSLPDRLRKQVDYMELNPDVDILGGAFYINEHIYQLPKEDTDCKIILLQKPCFGHPTVILRAKSLKENHIKYDESVLYGQDYRMWVDGAIAGFRFANLTEPVLFYRTHSGQVSDHKKIKQDQFMCETRLKYASYVFGKISSKRMKEYHRFWNNNISTGRQYFFIKSYLKNIIQKNNKFSQNALIQFINNQFDKVFLILIRSRNKKFSLIDIFFFVIDNRFRSLLSVNERKIFLKRSLVNVRNGFSNYTLL